MAACADDFDAWITRSKALEQIALLKGSPDRDVEKTPAPRGRRKGCHLRVVERFDRCSDFALKCGGILQRRRQSRDHLVDVDRPLCPATSESEVTVDAKRLTLLVVTKAKTLQQILHPVPLFFHRLGRAVTGFDLVNVPG
ncbi:hypothetical protein X980_6089 [Burkholderia pseudomallei MSHR4000]|nr:hypothetical protein X980_6089 [Burkholderia pseudomallei MSHR4000]